MKTIINKNQFLALFIALFAVTAFNACSDVAGPDDTNNLMSEKQELDSNLFASSGNDDTDNNDGGIGSDEVNETCTIKDSSVLKASNRGYNAGNVEYEIIDGDLVVTYNAVSGVTIDETHLWVGTDINDMPHSKGNGAPKNGHFPYGGSYNGVTTAQYIIPLSDIENYDANSPLIIVAHAVVNGSSAASFRGGETAYAGEEEGKSKRWYWYISFDQVEECVPVDGEGGSAIS